MFFPKHARTLIAKAFYDKPLELLKVVQEQDEEGGLLPPTLTSVANLLGNVNPSTTMAVEEFGQNTTATAVITISREDGAKIKLADKLSVSGVVYEVIELHGYDSHTTLGVRQWQTR